MRNKRNVIFYVYLLLTIGNEFFLGRILILCSIVLVSFFQSCKIMADLIRTASHYSSLTRDWPLLLSSRFRAKKHSVKREETKDRKPQVSNYGTKKPIEKV